MMRKNRIILKFWIIITILIVYSCDCPVHVRGTVLDSETKLPIENVSIGKTDTTELDNPFNRKTHTDINGYFQFNGNAGKCDKVTLFFLVENYKTEKVELDNNSIDTILMKKK